MLASQLQTQVEISGSRFSTNPTHEQSSSNCDHLQNWPVTLCQSYLRHEIGTTSWYATCTLQLKLYCYFMYPEVTKLSRA